MVLACVAMRWAGAYVVAVAIVAIVFGAAIMFGGFRAVERSDYMTYQVATQIILDGNGDCLYDISCQTDAQRALIGTEQTFTGGALPFNSPPWLAAILLPLGLLPLTVAFTVFVIGSMALLALATWLLGGRGHASEAISAMLLLTAWPTVMGAIRGQSTIAVVALLGFSVAGSGTALGLSALKPTLGPVWAVWLLARGRWRELAWAAAVVLGLITLAAVVVSPKALLDYPTHLLGVAAPDAVGVHVEEMVNWRGAAMRLGAGAWLFVAGTVATIALLALAWTWSRSREMAAAAAFIATPLILPHANQHEAILAALGVVLAIGAAGEARSRVATAGVATHAVLWAGPAMAAEASAWMLFGAQLLWLGAVVWLARREAASPPTP
jgi:hypothetical protein